MVGIYYNIIVAIFKRLFFVPFFLSMLFTAISSGKIFLEDFNLIFSIDINVFYQMLLFSSALFFTGIFFSVFITLSQNLKIALPVILLASVIPFFVLPQALAAVFSIGIIIAGTVQYLILKGRLNTYVNFRPSELLSSIVKDLAGMLVIVFAVVYFMSANSFIAQNGFQIPDAIFDTVSKLVPLPEEGQLFENAELTKELPISKKQLESLKQNPQLLKQFGLNPSALDKLTMNEKGAQIPSTKEFLKQTFNTQIQELIKPYQHFIPIILGILFFFTIRSILSVYLFTTSFFIWIIFALLEKTGFISFTKEMREVRKLQV